MLTLGKHSGKTLLQVLDEDHAYLDWLTDSNKHDVREAAIEMCKRYPYEVQ